MLKPIELESFRPEETPHPSWSSFKFRFTEDPEHPLGRYIEGPTTRVLIWNGSLDFAKLNEEIFQDLINPTVKRFKKMTRGATFTVDNQQVKLDLNDPAQWTRCREVIKNYQKISVARVDILGSAKPNRFIFSTELENPQYSPEGQAEFSLAVPLRRPFSIRELMWMGTHHFESRAVEIDLHQAVRAFSNPPRN